jgi:lipoprotein-releasing system permease protein
MSGLGVAVGVALLYVATSVMGGFGYEIRRMIVDTQGEIQISSRGLIGDADSVIEQVLSVEGVAAATANAHGVVMLEHRQIPAFPGIQGIDINTVSDVFDLENYLVRGRLDDLDDDAVILSLQLARNLGVGMGGEVEVYSPLVIEKFRRDEVFLPRVLRVVGLIEIGHQELDQNMVICTLRRMQELYGLGDSVHGINVRLKPGFDEFEIVGAIDDVLPPGYRALTWFESNADFQSVVRFEKYMVFFLLMFIVVVAALSIMSSLLIAVVRKTREIGLLGALGARPKDVALCFCVQGFFLGLCGTLAGLAFGWLVLKFRNEIVEVLASVTVGKEVFIRFYQFVNLPAHTTTFDITIIVIGSIVISTLAGLVPAWRAAKLKPVEALRSE